MFQVLQLISGPSPEDIEGYIVYLPGQDDHDPEDCCDEWNTVVEHVNALPIFTNIDDAVKEARKIPLHGYTWSGVEVHDGGKVYTVR